MALTDVYDPFQDWHLNRNPALTDCVKIGAHHELNSFCHLAMTKRCLIELLMEFRDDRIHIGFISCRDVMAYDIVP